MTRFADHLTGAADVLLPAAENGEIRLNIGDKATGAGFAADVAMWCPEGFYGVPNPDDDDGACQVLFLQDGQQKRIVGARDGRYWTKAGALKPGDRVIISRGAARLLLKVETDTISLYSENQTAPETESTMLVSVDGKNGELTLTNGAARILLKKDSITLAVNGGGGITIDADGVQFIGQQFAANCTTCTVGLTPAGTPPVPGIGSALKGVSGPLASPSTSVTIA